MYMHILYYTYVCMHACMYACMYIHTYVRMYTPAIDTQEQVILHQELVQIVF